MLVKDIMKTDVKTTSSLTTVKKAAEIMSENDIGCLLIVDDVLKGIITERDMVKRVVAAGLDVRKTRISRVMTKHVFFVSPDDDLHKTINIMTSRHVKRLPVIYANEVVGIITFTDIIESQPKIIQEIYRSRFI